ncbi:MAG TPA: prepilin-type N-terminal cleavage/methylation domain-containing protein, partial [Terriglobales bacterium]|nr:prepilin-type N-terminal cleavage/methylation domain-containing protein [Terriglobales bacterium]
MLQTQRKSCLCPQRPIRRRKASRRDEGFTLIELLVVVAIISLLSSIGLIAFQDARQKSRDAKRLSDMTQMANALEIY